MKVFICADLEGVGCVVRSEHTSPGGREYDRARRFFTAEVNAAVDAACAAGATDVLVADSHNVGLNLLPEMLDDRARLVMGGPRPLAMVEGIQEGFDAVLFVGAHVMAGTPDAAIPHIFHGRVAELRVNGLRIGEMGLNALLAGYYNAPVVFVSGDEAACVEAKILLPNVESVAVKRGVGSYAAISHPPSRCVELIAAGVSRALARRQQCKPLHVTAPVRLEARFTTASGADRAARLPGAVREDAMEVSYTAQDMLEAFKAFNTMADEVESVPFI